MRSSTDGDDALCLLLLLLLFVVVVVVVVVVCCCCFRHKTFNDSGHSQLECEVPESRQRSSEREEGKRGRASGSPRE